MIKSRWSPGHHDCISHINVHRLWKSWWVTAGSWMTLLFETGLYYRWPITESMRIDSIIHIKTFSTSNYKELKLILIIIKKNHINFLICINWCIIFFCVWLWSNLNCIYNFDIYICLFELCMCIVMHYCALYIISFLF